MKTKVVKKENEGVKVIPLGGLESIGMNITAFEYGDSIIVVDCGLSFPADDMLGIDLVIPDVTYLHCTILKLPDFPPMSWKEESSEVFLPPWTYLLPGDLSLMYDAYPLQRSPSPVSVTADHKYPKNQRRLFLYSRI